MKQKLYIAIYIYIYLLFPEISSEVRGKKGLHFHTTLFNDLTNLLLYINCHSYIYTPSWDIYIYIYKRDSNFLIWHGRSAFREFLWFYGVKQVSLRFSKICM